MTTFHIITIFPKIFDSYFSESIIKRARENNLFEIKVYNLRDYAKDKHKTVDDTPYGGGAGMVMKVEPIYNCLQVIKFQISNFKFQKKAQVQSRNNEKTRTILFSAKGEKYTQTDAKRLAKCENLILICGRYEGVDERVIKYLADEEISIGDYVLTGGELPAMVLVDSVARLIPNVLGNIASLKDESFFKKGYLEYPQYTKPENFKGWRVPKILLSGNHKEIEKWKSQKSQSRALRLKEKNEKN